MGVVYQARHIFLKTAHAIKVILPDLVGNDPMRVPSPFLCQRNPATTQSQSRSCFTFIITRLFGS